MMIWKRSAKSNFVRIGLADLSISVMIVIILWNSFLKTEISPIEENVASKPETLFEVIQQYTSSIAGRNSANEKLQKEKLELLNRMNSDVRLNEESQLKNWQQDDLTAWIRKQLQEGNQLLRVGQQLLWTMDYEEYKSDYGELLDHLTLSFFEIQEQWEFGMLQQPSIESVLDAISLIHELKPQWEGSLLGARWFFFEQEFNRFVFYIFQEDINLDGSINELHWHLAEQTATQYPESLLNQTLTHYNDLRTKNKTHEEAIAVLIQSELK